MKQILNNSIFKIVGIATLVLGIVIISGCEKFPLPEAGSQTDSTPPKAAFSTASSISDYQTIEFSNLSISATEYMWDFGDGNTSTLANPTNTYADGTYNVTLTAMDNLGATGSITQEVVVAPGPYQPIILESGFEDNTLPDGSGDGRDSWRTSTYGNGSWATIVGITGSPVTFGSQGGKLEVSSARAGYQEIVVEANTVYDLSFWYTMKNDKPDPWAIVSIVAVTENAPIDSKAKAAASTIASITVNDTSDPSTYVTETLSFDSGDNTTIAIYFYNDANVEARFDEFEIDLGTPGAVPPSPGFDLVQSDANYLEYTFTNTSTDAVSFEWDFGDGNTSTDESPTHTYATANNYDVTLTILNDAGLDASLTKSIDIQAPVTVNCSWEVDPGDYRTVHFIDSSVGAETLLWEFGDGYQFTGMDPTHTYTEDGIYTVTLTSTSVTGLEDSKQFDVTISEGFIATISEASFEDNDPTAAACGSGQDGRDCWRNSALGGPIQITSGPVVSGSQAAKLPSDGSRIGYQRVMVEPNMQYDVTFNYTMKTGSAGSLTVSILDGSTLTDISQVAGATIASTTVSDQTDANAYVTETVSFNSGSRSEVAIFFTNEGVETRLDDLSIEVGEVPMLGEGGFEDNSLADGTGDGRDSWRNSALGGVIQITSGPVVSGSQAAKLPSDGSRVGYQKIAVATNTMYTLTYNYTMKTSPTGSLTVSILDGTTLNDISEVPAATIATSMVNDQTDANAYITETISFNSGNNAEIAVFFNNTDVETRIDDISLGLTAGFVPMVDEGGFEPNSLSDGTGNGKDTWRNALGGVIQITSSPVHSGAKAAKLPSAGDRVGMQEVTVEPNTNYRVSFYYTMKTSPTGSLTVSILDNTASTLTDLTQVPGATITSVSLNDQTDANVYIMETMEFNSGANSTISIFFHNQDVECRLDDISITTL